MKNKLFALLALLITAPALAGTSYFEDLVCTSQTASTVPYFDANKKLTSSSVTPTQLGYLDATSSIQTQINAKLASSSFSDSGVTEKLITGYTSGAGTVAATDSILQAIQKLNGNNVNTTTTANAALPSASFTDAAVTGKLITGFSSGAGTVAATDTILQAINKLNGNVAGKQASLGYTAENTANKGAANGYASLDASSLIPITQIPPAALERLVVVADQTARYALTTATVQLGDTVKQTDTGSMYFVIDTANLGNSAGYSIYTAGTASSVAWSGITGIPSAVSTLGSTGNSTGFTGSLAGDVGGTQGATTIAASVVTGKAITGFSSGAGTVAATDTILQAVNKLDGNDGLKAPLASPTFSGTVTSGGDIQLNGAAAARYVMKGSTDGWMVLTGGTGDNGGRLSLYGGTHATKANSLELIAGAGTYTFTATTLTVPSALNVGGLTASTMVGTDSSKNLVSMSHFQEVPSGTINGSNVTFTLANTPMAAASVLFYMDGFMLTQGSGKDYTISGATITMAVAPVVGQTLWASYMK